ncbi:hypothetical protein BDV33DRAFT_196506 [Aspergillus novoparasiticus]|uniref:Uncharacterized protein n=1 Tax=Aspergillus novoparasiticus TaxID=986946 RepID=A0A5N6EC17_9EURO|nr:hypothetical protein BDV33DRAFT_196506 [Aspergillus novoparasiticus]
MDVQGSGRECWESSPCMEIHESSPLASITYHSPKSIGLDPEFNGHGQAPAVCVSESPCEYDMSPNRGMLTPTEEPPVDAEFSQVDLNEWYPRYWACMQHFLSQGQHSPQVQSLAAFVNIRLPYQRSTVPVIGFPAPQNMDSGVEGTYNAPSLRPFIRRLIVTGYDTPSVLQAFFGDDWQAGVGCVCKQERINYLFTAKSGGWTSTKAAYDMLPDEQTPFLRPLRDATEEELRIAESRWTPLRILKPRDLLYSVGEDDQGNCTGRFEYELIDSFLRAIAYNAVYKDQPGTPAMSFDGLKDGACRLARKYSSLKLIISPLSYPASDGSPKAFLGVSYRADAPTSPWLAAYVDLFAGRETQIVIYSSLEAQATSPVLESDFVSILRASRESLELARAQLLALLSHVKTYLLPDYLSSIQSTGSSLLPNNLGRDPASKHSGLIPAPPPQAFLIGNLHTGLFSLLRASGDYTHSDPVPGLRVHRFDNPPYVKYLFRGQDFVIDSSDSSDSPGRALAPLPDGFRFTDKEGRIGVQPHQYDLIRFRTNVPRSRGTLTKLPGVTIYSDCETQLQPHLSDSSDAAENSSDGAPLGEMPIAWAFLGIDGSLATLHVEPEYRGQKLALHVSKEAMRRGMAEGGIWRHCGEEGEAWVHANVLESNIASRRVMEKLGGDIGWTSFYCLGENYAYRTDNIS